MLSHAEKRERLAAQIRGAGSQPVRLGKSTSNLFRDRPSDGARALDVGDFNDVLDIDPEAGTIEVEGMTTYARLIDATLPHGVMPSVVPQLKSITIGGAVSGVGIESSSFRHGLPHETVLEMDVLLADGRIVTCTADNDHADLFRGIPNSYGTLGYVLRLKVLAFPVRHYVELSHHRFDDPGDFFAAVAGECRGDADFVDGTVFDEHEHYMIVGRFVDQAPYVSDYTWMNIYYRSIRNRRQDYLTTHDYLWRWDTDWFWCSKNLYVQHPLVRRLAGRKRLNSVTYTRVMRWNSRWGLTRTLNRLVGANPESVIQDVDIPIERAGEFLEFFHREIGIRPIWICPIGSHDPGARFPLYPIDTSRLYVNFGFWDVVRPRARHEPGHFNRLVERKVAELGGIKSLYSDSYYSRDEFWSIYDGDAYRALKARYDPDGRLRDLYRKCVLRE